MMSLPDFSFKQLIFFNSTTEKAKMRFQLENIIIENEDKKVILQHSCHRIFALFIIGNLTITNIVLQKAKSFGFPIILLNRNLRPYCHINNHAEGNFLIRQKQYSTSSDHNHQIASRIIHNKINNQISLLKKLRYHSEKEKNAISKLNQISLQFPTDSTHLRNLEGFAAKIFFQTYFRNLNWQHRAPRTKCDITNLLLDMGYSYLFHFVEAIASIYGLDLFCGVFHRFFYQRKSLVCDFVEPFRCIIDQRILKAHNLNQIKEDDFYVKQNTTFLKYQAQNKYIKLFLKDLLHHKEAIFLYIQSYYRWFAKDKPLNQFPYFCIINNAPKEFAEDNPNNC